MAEYYVIKDKNTGLYFRGKGVNRWGKYFNQASIYRVKGMAEHMIEEISWRGEQAEVVPIKIFEPTADVVEVVRCKDCVYCNEYQKWNFDRYLGCNFNSEIYNVEPTHFCSYGERRTDNDCI